jgi:hypothetical protein
MPTDARLELLGGTPFVAVLRIHMPPLRRRITDLPILVAHFLDF